MAEQTCTIPVLVPYATTPRFRLCGQQIVRHERCSRHARALEAQR